MAGFVIHVSLALQRHHLVFLKVKPWSEYGDSIICVMGLLLTVQMTYLGFDSSQGNDEQERFQRMESAQNEFRNEFRRRFHISVDDSEVSGGGQNSRILQWVSLSPLFIGAIMKYFITIYIHIFIFIFFLDKLIFTYFAEVSCLIEFVSIVVFYGIFNAFLSNCLCICF